MMYLLICNWLEFEKKKKMNKKKLTMSLIITTLF